MVKQGGGETVISVSGLGKRYRIGVAKERPDSLLGTMVQALRSPFENYRRHRSLYKFGNSEEGNGIFWALKDVSFSVRSGEVVGIIGQNGAGKSTLLKVLSRITDPTEGRAVIKGRIASLLEVGTGFHPELTGRENVYLNGTILGMTKREVEQRFEEIVEFADIRQFLDTPVKRYSSGMKMRLAFSVAAHLSAEVMIIDEVLAVGDVKFQRKCLDKMDSVAKSGRTVLFVSHNMPAVQSLCDRVLILERGSILFDGDTKEGLSRYMKLMEDRRAIPLADREDRVGGDEFRFTDIQFLDESGEPQTCVFSGQSLIIRLHYSCAKRDGFKELWVGMSVKTQAGAHLFTCLNRAVGETLSIDPGNGVTECVINKLPLKAGRYFVEIYAGADWAVSDQVANAATLEVVAADYYGSGHIPHPGVPGVLVDYSWRGGFGQTHRSAKRTEVL